MRKKYMYNLIVILLHQKMFKSTTDIKKKRPSHTHENSEKCHKKHTKGSKVQEDEMICNSLLQRHLPRCQSHTGTQTDAAPTPTRSYEVKGYSGRIPDL